MKKSEFENWKNEKKPFMLHGFNSTTTEIDVAGKFTKNYDKAFFVALLIKINLSSKGDYQLPVKISSFSRYYSENEYLAPLNIFLNVKNIVPLGESILVETEI